MLDGTPRLPCRSRPRPAIWPAVPVPARHRRRAVNWHRQLAGLAGRHARRALDLRGYGDSTLASAPQPSTTIATTSCAWPKRLRRRRLVLVGLSYGAWIATSFAMRHPDRLLGLVLSGGCTGMSEAGPDEREAFRISREVPLNAGQTPADFAPAVVKVLAGPNASEAVRRRYTPPWPRSLP
jgi:pimeloyl-ACP methyl ester carboxylesterase